MAEWSASGERVADSPRGNRVSPSAAVLTTAWAFYREGLITREDRREFIREAARPDCGKRSPLRDFLEPQNRAEIQRIGLRFILSQEIAGRCVLEASKDMRLWQVLRTIEGPVIELTADAPPEEDSGRRFYRVRSEP